MHGHLLTSCSSSCLHGCTSVFKWKRLFSIGSPALEREQYCPYPVGLPFTSPSRCFHRLENETRVMRVQLRQHKLPCPKNECNKPSNDRKKPKLDSRLLKPWLEGMKMFGEHSGSGARDELASLFWKYSFSLSTRENAAWQESRMVLCLKVFSSLLFQSLGNV